ncbi:MAG: T9SS type A sorting domain-containing protein [Ferruginibacter sp.]
MKISFYKSLSFALVLFITFASFRSSGQVFEWRLVNPVFSSVDPDGAGPATGSATFKMQIHTTSGSVADVSAISVGWNYQSASAMIPAPPGCSIVSNPANVTVSSIFVSGGFAFTTVNQCGIFNQSAGGQSFDRRTVGTLDGTGLMINTTWIDVYTVTMWTLNGSSGGYVSINSGAGGTPAPFSTYAVSDVPANEYVANSLTYTIPLSLSGAIPVTFSKFNAQCTGSGALISWSTENEINSSHYEIEKSTDGTNWVTVATVNAAVNSSTSKDYQQIDLGNVSKALYRIKQVDKDGTYSYTNVARTNCESKLITILIYPVPANDKLNIIIKSDRSLKTELIVYDGLGQEVRRMNATITSGNNNFIFNLNNLSAGRYTIKSTETSLNLNKSFTIMH